MAGTFHISTLLALCSTVTVASGAEMSASDATNTARSTATTENSGYFSKLNSTTLVGQPAYTADEQSQTQYFQKGQGLLQAPGISRVSACTGKTDPECVAVQLMKNGRPTMTIGATDPLRTKVGDIRMTDPSGQLSGVLNSYSACGQVTTTTPAQHESRVCHERLQAEDARNCTAGLEVNVDVDANYQCKQTPYDLKQYNCSLILRVTCDTPADTCASGGIVPSTVSVSNGSYSFAFNGTTLTLKNNITSAFNVTSANFQFNIVGVDRVTNFKITGIESDNWVGVSINGKFVGTHTRYFNGFNAESDRLTLGPLRSCQVDPDQGIEFCNEYTVVWYSATQYGFPETGGGFYSPVNFDLKPYLKEGANVITMNVINGGGPGLGHIDIDVRQICPLNCRDEWDDSGCAGLSSRS